MKRPAHVSRVSSVSSLDGLVLAAQVIIFIGGAQAFWVHVYESICLSLIAGATSCILAHVLLLRDLFPRKR